MKKILFKHRYLGLIMIGFFLGILFSYSRSGTGNLTGSNKDAVTSTKRNQLLSKFDAAIGRSGPDTLTANSGDKLTTTKWNALVDKVNTYANGAVCTNNNGGNCTINTATKSALESNLVAGNIKSGVTVFGIAGSLSVPASCTNDNGGNCTINTATKSALESNLVAGNIKSGTTIFGVAGSYVGGCSTPGKCVKSDGTCGTVYLNRERRRTDAGYMDGPFGNMALAWNSFTQIISAGGAGSAYVSISCQ